MAQGLTLARQAASLMKKILLKSKISKIIRQWWRMKTSSRSRTCSLYQNSIATYKRGNLTRSGHRSAV